MPRCLSGGDKEREASPPATVHVSVTANSGRRVLARRAAPEPAAEQRGHKRARTSHR